MVLTQEQHNYIVGIYHNLRKEKERIPYIDEALPLFNKRFGFEISRSTILRKWKIECFELQGEGNSKGGRISKSDFLVIYNECNNELNCIIEKTKYSRKNILRLCHKYNLNYHIQSVKKIQHINQKYLRYTTRGLEDRF